MEKRIGKAKTVNLDTKVPALGVVLIAYETMLQTPDNPTPRDCMFRFCQHLERCGYGDTADNIFSGVLNVDRKLGEKWIKAVFKKFISDDTGLAEFVIHGKEMK